MPTVVDGGEISRRILAIFAHPDDETFLAGGTLAKYAASGWKVFLLCATRGEAGRRGANETLTAEEFADVRQKELEEACAALGIEAPMFLSCADQKVASNCQQSAAEECVQLITRLKPEIVISFGPDGVSGHPDHVAMSTIVTDAFKAACQSSNKNAVGEGTIPLRALYYVLGPQTVPRSCKAKTPHVPQLVTHVIDIREFGERKLAAIQCYRSQQHLIPRESTDLAAISDEPERFHRAFPPWCGSQPEEEL